MGELLELHTRLGRAEAVQRLLAELGERPLGGAASESLAIAREGLVQMLEHPETALRCGAEATRSLLHTMGESSDWVDTVAADAHGMSLGQLARTAQAQGIELVPVRVATNDEPPLPAVMHWRAGHFGTLLERSGNRYRVFDPAWGTERWITRDTLVSETSGHYLAPAALATDEVLSTADADAVRGAGYTSTVDTTATSPDDEKECLPDPEPDCSESLGMPTYAVHSVVVSLSITDTPLRYTVPRGPAVPFTLTYNHREATQPANFSYFNVGQKWNFSWLSFVEDDPQSPGAGVRRMSAGGGALSYRGYHAGTGAFAPEARAGAVLIRTGAASYERHLNDGSREIYALSDGATHAPRRIFLSRIEDPAGNAVVLNYDSALRLVAIEDAAGQRSTFEYGDAAFPLQITAITDPFGRSASIRYDSTGRLVVLTAIQN